MLKRKLIVIDCLNRICLNCDDRDCMHNQAYVQCLDLGLEACTSCRLQDTTYFIINKKIIFLTNKDSYHCYLNQGQSWICETCTFKCIHKYKITDIIGENELLIDSPSTKFKSSDFSTISTQSIPLNLDKPLASIYNKQLSHGISLPNHLLPECEICENGYTYIQFRRPVFKTRKNRNRSLYRKRYN